MHTAINDLLISQSEFYDTATTLRESTIIAVATEYTWECTISYIVQRQLNVNYLLLVVSLYFK